MSSCKYTPRQPLQAHTGGSASLMVILNIPSDQMTPFEGDRLRLIQGPPTHTPIHQAAGGIDSGGVATTTS
jgi:hypothetical protein